MFLSIHLLVEVDALEHHTARAFHHAHHLLRALGMLWLHVNEVGVRDLDLGVVGRQYRVMRCVIVHCSIDIKGVQWLRSIQGLPVLFTVQ